MNVLKLAVLQEIRSYEMIIHRFVKSFEREANVLKSMILRFDLTDITSTLQFENIQNMKVGLTLMVLR